MEDLGLSDTGIAIIKGAQGTASVKTIASFTAGFILVMVTLFIVLNLKHSRAGRAIMALRDNRIAAESVGIGATKYKLMAFVTSAVLAGAVCGDHISPISDTTIMSSSGAQSNHINHVQTQMQYAMVVVAACVPGYLIAGFTENWLITLVSSLAILTAALLYLRRRSLAEDARA